MGTLSGGEIGGMVGIAGAFLAIFWKMWIDHTKLANKVTDAFIKNAIAQNEATNAVKEMKASVEQNSELTKQNTIMNRETSQNFTDLLSQLIRLK